MSNNSDRKWYWWIILPENKVWRFGLLFAGAVLGIALAKYSAGPLACLVGFSPPSPNTQFRLLLLGLPVFILLWWFRTYDVQKQVQQANFATGIVNLASGNPLSIDIGVAILLQVSNLTSAFDKEIKIAFIRRLKELPQDLDGVRVAAMRANRLTYAQYILRWLIEQQEKHGGELPDLTGMDCRYQAFMTWDKPGKRLPLCKVLGKASSSEAGYGDPIPEYEDVTFLVTFQDADLASLDFTDVRLECYDFTDVISANVIGAFAGNCIPDISISEDAKDSRIINNNFLLKPAEPTDKKVKRFIENKAYFSDRFRNQPEPIKL